MATGGKYNMKASSTTHQRSALPRKPLIIITTILFILIFTLYILLPTITPIILPIMIGTTPEYGDAGTPHYTTTGPLNLIATWENIQDSPAFTTFTERHGTVNLTAIHLECDGESGAARIIKYKCYALDGYRATIFYDDAGYPTFRLYEREPYTGLTHDITPYLPTIHAHGLLTYVQTTWTLYNTNYTTEDYATITISATPNTHIPYIHIELYTSQPGGWTGHNHVATLLLNDTLAT